MTVSHAPSRSSAIQTAAGGTVAAVPAVGGGLAALASIVGLVALLVGVSRGSRRTVTAGAVGLYLGILVAGITHAHPGVLVAGAAGTIVAWDSAENAVILHEQLSSSAETRRAELVHVAVTAGVVSVAAVGAYVVYVTVTGQRPTVVLVVLLVAALVLVGSLSRP